MACSGCVRAGCYCDFCAPSTAPYLPKTPAYWTINPVGFADFLTTPYSLFNGSRDLNYSPTGGNSCVWSVIQTRYEILLVGGDEASDFELVLRLRDTGCMATYTTLAFDCESTNTFQNPVFTCGPPPGFPLTIDATPSTLLTDCCFRVPMTLPPSVLYATIQNVENAACIEGTYELNLDTSSDDRFRYVHWDGDNDTAIELDCGRDRARYWNIKATINGCALTRASVCDGSAPNEDDESTYDPLILQFANLVVYRRYANNSCCASSEGNCDTIAARASVLVTP